MNRRRIASLTLLIAVTAGVTGLTASPAAAAETATSGVPPVGPYCWQVPPGWAGLCQPGFPWF